MTRPARVLLIEDNPADVELAREALSESRFPVDLAVATDGVQALELLERADSRAGDRLPDLVVLDLNLPRLDGREVLRRIKGHEHLRRIPVVILTSSDADRDVEGSYDLGANCYVTKPLKLGAFRAIVRQVESFWLTIVKLPPQAQRGTG